MHHLRGTLHMRSLEANAFNPVTSPAATNHVNTPRHHSCIEMSYFFISDTCAFEECEWFNIISAYRMQMAKDYADNHRKHTSYVHSMVTVFPHQLTEESFVTIEAHPASIYYLEA
jgi:hypothetical protein